jgi:hypothetical protein
MFFTFFEFCHKCLFRHIFTVGHHCHIACGTQTISWLVKHHWNFRLVCCERGNVIYCVWRWGSAAIKQRHALSQTSKQLVAQLFPHDSLSYTPTHLDGTWTESLKLQACGSLMVQTWSQYFFLTSLWKLWSTSTPSGRLEQEESVKCLLLKCFISCWVCGHYDILSHH